MRYCARQSSAEIAVSEAIRLLNANDVCALARVSRSTLFKMVREDKCPKPIHLQPKVSRWRSDEIAAWIEGLSESRTVEPRAA